MQKSLYHDEKGNAAISGTLISIIVVAIVIGLCGMIIANMQPFIVGNSNESNASISTIFETTWSVLSISPVVMIVMVAALIIGAVYALQPRY